MGAADTFRRRRCVDANTQRVSKGAASLPLRLWNGALNALNAADMGMHVLYAAALAAAIAEPGPAAATAAVAAAGSLAALAALRAAGGGAVRTPTADAVRAASAGASAGLGGARDVRGHTVVVTGASSGIGFEARAPEDLYRPKICCSHQRTTLLRLPCPAQYACSATLSISDAPRTLPGSPPAAGTGSERPPPLPRRRDCRGSFRIEDHPVHTSNRGRLLLCR